MGGELAVSTGLRSRLLALLAAVAAGVALVAECVTPAIDRWEVIVVTAVTVLIALIEAVLYP